MLVLEQLGLNPGDIDLMITGFKIPAEEIFEVIEAGEIAIFCSRQAYREFVMQEGLPRTGVSLTDGRVAYRLPPED